ncbi:MAG: HAD domain-containing protein [Massilia sp.]
MTTPYILYLDYDGILHPADVRVTREEPLRPRLYVRGEPTDQPLFLYASLLELILAPYPDLKIILATSWVRAFGYEYALGQLSPALQSRVIGAATFPVPTRFNSIDIDAQERGLNRWLALDDDVCGWPDERRYQVVAPTDPLLGLAQPGIAAELACRLEVLSTGESPELIAKSAVPLKARTLTELMAIPSATESRVLAAMEETARADVILFQVRRGINVI